jgi:hypothetical protein
MLGAFYAGLEAAARVLVISLAADEAGWRMAARARPGRPALRLRGLWSDSPCAGWADWISPPPPPGDPDHVIFRHTLAAIVALQATHHDGLVLGRTVLFRSSCPEALLALQHGDFRRPAVQDAAMLFGAGCLDLGLPPPLFVPCPLPGAGPGPGPSPGLAAADVDWNASSPALCTCSSRAGTSLCAALSAGGFTKFQAGLSRMAFNTAPLA